MTTVTTSSYTEGPSYDPYGVDIITVNRAGIEYMLESHALGDDVLEIADHEIICDNHKQAYRIFTQASGGNPMQWMRWHERAHSRCKCGCRRFESMRGYPGESFDVCSNCGEVVNSYFNESAII